MAALHEPGEVWHIGWDWYAHMWFVEPPFDVDLDEPIKWFTDRHQAFDYVDEWIRTQPVQVSVLDQMDVPTPEPPQPEFDVVTPEPVADVPVYTPEPVRELSAPVHIPSLEEAQTAQERRLAEYARRVGIK